MGYLPGMLENLHADYLTHKSRGSLAIFETENLCRWVKTISERLVDDQAWNQCRAEVGAPNRPALAVSLDPDGRRASVAMAWRVDERIALRIVADVTGDPIDTDAIGEMLRELETKHNATVAHDPLDGVVMKYVRKNHAESVTGAKFSAASSTFANLVASGRLAWADADAVTDDLTWTARTAPSIDGGWHAVRANDEHPITAALAAIRAIYLAADPKRPGGLRVQ
jgi:hypothetical protein